MINIKILGTGCNKCRVTYNNVLEAVKETGVKANVQKIEDITEIMNYNIMTTPALMINEVIVAKGRVPGKEEIKTILMEKE
jgi:small redox-active disulfide protein 2